MTALDVISEDSERYKTIVRPLLRYTDYLTVNEIEAERITGIRLTGEDGALLEENVLTALREMFSLGVSRSAIIHAPTAAFGMDANGIFSREQGKNPAQGLYQGHCRRWGCLLRWCAAGGLPQASCLGSASLWQRGGGTVSAHGYIQWCCNPDRRLHD